MHCFYLIECWLLSSMLSIHDSIIKSSLSIGYGVLMMPLFCCFCCCAYVRKLHFEALHSWGSLNYNLINVNLSFKSSCWWHSLYSLGIATCDLCVCIKINVDESFYAELDLVFMTWSFWLWDWLRFTDLNERVYSWHFFWSRVNLCLLNIEVISALDSVVVDEHTTRGLARVTADWSPTLYNSSWKLELQRTRQFKKPV
jgi:hypothetical protein